MIGGKDIVIPTSAGAEAIAVVLDATSPVWPDAVVEDAETGEVINRSAVGAFKGKCEILIYQNQAFADQWHELGADESLIGTMLHVVLAVDQITIVVDSAPPPEIESLVSSIRHLLRQRAGRQRAKMGA